ncbi:MULTISPECIES: peptidoglycan DD-metalloendopeptidase family protein [Streptomyces]
MAYTPSEAIRLARKESGYRETGENDTKFNREFGKIPGYPHSGYGYPWCQSFQSIIHKHAGGRPNVDYPYTAACSVATAWYKRNGRWSSTPQPGDMLMYGPGGGTHVDMVTEVEPSRVKVIGGNTGGNMNGAYYNGNGVYEKWVSRSNGKIHGYGRPKFSGETKPPVVNPSTGHGGKPSGGKYTIKKGQTLTAIAAILGVSVAALLAANPFVKDKNKIKEGDKLDIPSNTSKPSEKPKEPTKEPAKPKDGVYVTTQANETLTSIAKKLGISAADLVTANGGMGGLVPLSKGSEVKLPKGATAKPSEKPTSKPTTPAKPAPDTVCKDPKPPVKPTTPPVKPKPSTSSTTYTVKKGDTLSGIAERHGLKLSTLLKLNPGKFPNPNVIKPGQKVTVKGTPKAHSPATGERPSTSVTSKPVAPQERPAERPAVTPAPLTPHGFSGPQRMWDRPLTAAELQNARTIYDVAVQTFGPVDGPRAAVIGIATAYQESRLQNLSNGDRDSAGLFQQRPSMGWGTHAQVTNPTYAAGKFFSVLKTTNWKSVPLTVAAQTVQRSGTPSAFGKWEKAAAETVSAFLKRTPAPRTEKPADPPVKVPVTRAEYVKPVNAAMGTPFGKPGSMWSSGYHTGTDFPAPQGTSVAATKAGKVVQASWAGAYGNQVVIDHGNGVRSSYAHLSAFSVAVGASVSQGQQIGNVGTTGNSTGPHLHLEFRMNGVQVDPMKFIKG